jgi:hypothetical protein
VSEGKSRVVLGSLRVEGVRLTLECNSRQRLEDGTALIASLAGGALQEKGREFQGLKSAMDGHMTGLTVKMPDKDHFTQEWTYEEKGKATTNLFRFTRKS